MQTVYCAYPGILCHSVVPPNVVTEITILNITSTSIFIALEFGFNGNGILTEVFVVYETISNQEFDESELAQFPEIETEPVPSQLEINGLQPFTTYRFSVEVLNAAGSSGTRSIIASTLSERKC